MRLHGTPAVRHFSNQSPVNDHIAHLFPLDFAGGVRLPACQRITLPPSPSAATPKGARRG